MTTKQILFRLEDSTAKALENKLNEKGISKQFLFSKVVDLFINDKLSFDSNLIASSDKKKITIDSNEVAETIKKHYLTDLANLIASDNNLIALVTERLDSNVLDKLEADNKSYQINSKSYDNNVIANDIEEPTIVETETAELELEDEGTITPEKENKPLTGDWSGAKREVLKGRPLIRRFNQKEGVNLNETTGLKKYWSKGKDYFMNWSRERDPDGHSWWLVDESDPKKGYKIVG